MEDKTVTAREMHEYQKNLQEKYQVQWGEPISPRMAVRKMLWAYGELAEASDIMKKIGDEAILHDPETRRHFVEELGDAMMYLYDVMLCYDISPEEFSEVYRAKCERNKNRWG